MSWKQEPGPDGRTIWRGVDSIRNTTADSVKGVSPALWCMLLMGAAGVPMIASGGPGLLLGVPLLLLVPPALWALFAVKNEGGLSSKQWLNASWRLRAEAGGVLWYVNEGDDPIEGSEWRVLLDQIATVEAGTSSQFTPARKIGGALLATSPHEWQTFLVLSDQSRRVVYTANADREGAVTLAASIRAHVERVRAKPAPIAAALPPRVDGKGWWGKDHSGVGFGWSANDDSWVIGAMYAPGPDSFGGEVDGVTWPGFDHAALIRIDVSGRYAVAIKRDGSSLVIAQADDADVLAASINERLRLVPPPSAPPSGEGFDL